jgi:hypothetical protein
MPDGPADLHRTPELGVAVAAARAELERAVTLGGLQNDPLRHPLQALSLHLQTLHRLSVDVTSALDRAAEEARRPIRQEEIRRVGQAAADGAAAFAKRLVWTETARLVLLAAGILAGTNAITGALCWWLGHRAETAVVQQAADSLPAAAATYGADAAPVWFGLMQHNDIRAALASCSRFDSNGRSACRVALWLEPAPPPKADGTSQQP